MVLGPHSYNPHLVCRPNASGGFKWSELVAERDGEAVEQPAEVEPVDEVEDAA
jgi:hypothetical protein